MNKREILDVKTKKMTFFLDIHDYGQDHWLAMCFVVEEFCQIILNATLEFDAVNAFSTLKNTHD
jgi:hypothetical protein